MKPKAEEWQSNCVTKLLPLQGKGFDVVLDDLRFDYTSGLSGRFELREKGSQKAARTIRDFTLAPADAFGSMAAEDLDEELATWSQWLLGQPLATLAKLDAKKLGPFQPLRGEALGDAYVAWKKKHDPKPKARIARQKKVLDEVAQRFEPFAAHVKKVWGLPVPRSLIAVRALIDFGLAEDDSMATRVVRHSELRSAGILERLAAGGLARKVQKGKDERCLGRYYRDPPEFLTFLHGGEDGLHFGLWYDEQNAPPSRVVLNYARDSSETWLAGSTPMTAIRERFAQREPAPGRGDFRRRFLLEIIQWFVDAEAELEDRRGKAPSHLPDPSGILGGWGVTCAGEGSPCEVVSTTDDVLGGQPAVLKKWLKEAEKRMAKGDVRMALVLGRSMHWKGGPLCEKTSGPLLEKAYAALGRKALLGITRAHYAHRDDPSVDVFVSEE